ncbi:MAG: S24 family peptidase [Bryobacteraceae bacterium]
MPARTAVIPIHARCRGEYVRLQLAQPGKPIHDIAVLLIDSAEDSTRHALRFRQHWDDIADQDDLEYLDALEQDCRDTIDRLGARGMLESWEDSLSNILRVSDRSVVAVDSFSRVADELFEQYVEKIQVQEFRTHLPLYTLRAAAGKFGTDEAVEEEGWVRVPENLRLQPGMFVAHVVGRSMEPRIPDGSLNVFRSPVVGSRQGKIVLAEVIGVHEKYTVKRYTSKKDQKSDDQWEHTEIVLEPLNPEFEDLPLTPDRLTVVAEWICTLE